MEDKSASIRQVANGFVVETKVYTHPPSTDGHPFDYPGKYEAKTLVFATFVEASDFLAEFFGTGA